MSKVKKRMNPIMVQELKEQEKLLKDIEEQKLEEKV